MPSKSPGNSGGHGFFETPGALHRKRGTQKHDHQGKCGGEQAGIIQRQKRDRFRLPQIGGLMVRPVCGIPAPQPARPGRNAHQRKRESPRPLVTQDRAKQTHDCPKKQPAANHPRKMVHHNRGQAGHPHKVAQQQEKQVEQDIVLRFGRELIVLEEVPACRLPHPRKIHRAVVDVVGKAGVDVPRRCPEPARHIRHRREKQRQCAQKPVKAAFAF